MPDVGSFVQASVYRYRLNRIVVQAPLLGEEFTLRWLFSYLHPYLSTTVEPH
jgi:hypothetical protein